MGVIIWYMHGKLSEEARDMDDPFIAFSLEYSYSLALLEVRKGL